MGEVPQRVKAKLGAHRRSPANGDARILERLPPPSERVPCPAQALHQPLTERVPNGLREDDPTTSPWQDSRKLFSMIYWIASISLRLSIAAKQEGEKLQRLRPFHDEKTPSFR
ncbi:MAG: hypothetical protein CM15mP103_02180 [Gammaproteobacteria bacterium]|nr:MAG: hypothetical protein CM15mP103_02180 [Gammaproteobacteria bacterium]